MKRLLFLIVLSWFSASAVASVTWNNSNSYCQTHSGGAENYCRTTYPTLQWRVISEGSCGADGTSTVWRCQYSLDACPEGTELNSQTGQCEGEPDPCLDSGAAEGSVYDPQTETCSCPEGQTDVFAPDASYTCQDELPECDESSSGFTGYFNDQPVCDWNDMCDAGEQGGYVNDQWVCMPEACDEGTWVNGACISPDDQDDQPGQEFDEKDTDGDGVPDSQDPDIDGDGVPNGQDPDTDGDGVPNEDESDQHDQGMASAEGGCGKPPVCTGDDPQQCAILKQQWYMMCYNGKPDKVTSELEKGKQQLTGAFNEIESDIQEFGNNGIGFKEEPNALKSAFLAYVPQPTNCIPFSLTFFDQTFVADCKLINDFKMVLGWLFSLYAMMYIWNLALKPVDR